MSKCWLANPLTNYVNVTATFDDGWENKRARLEALFFKI
jgi:hypothetical protein